MKSIIKTIGAAIALILILFAVFTVCGAGWQAGKMIVGM